MRAVNGCLRVEIGGLDPSVLREIHACFGGSLRLRSDMDRPYWVWSAGSHSADYFLDLVGPYLRVKAAQRWLAQLAWTEPNRHLRASLERMVSHLKRANFDA